MEPCVSSEIVEHIRPWLEILSFLAVIISVPFAAWELRTHFKEARESALQQSLEAARAVYREVDDKYNSFLALCLDHPRLDCFSTPQDCLQGVPLTPGELQQQRLLYTLLVDVCEVAFVEYHRHLDPRGGRTVTELFKGQWEGWRLYILKFMARPAFSAVWEDIKKEYDTDFSDFMNSISANSAASNP